DMVVGDRLSSTYYTENKRPFHNFGNDIVKNSINSLFHSDIKDIMTGYRAFSFEFVKTFPVLSHGFEIETEMTIHAVDKNMYVENIVIEYRDRPDGSVSKLNTYSDGMKVLLTIARLFRDYKPMQFFGIFAVMLMLFAFVIDIPILMTYFETGLVPRFPTLIVSGFIAMTALLLWFAGVILNTVIAKDRQEFEFRLHTVEQWKKKVMN
ncbi:MAG: glycosyl transferase, partial [Lachnospiraceae bacterium]|nr:glycosyl transferase [Lachnospiraceae bacterium]